MSLIFWECDLSTIYVSFSKKPSGYNNNLCTIATINSIKSDNNLCSMAIPATAIDFVQIVCKWIVSCAAYLIYGIPKAQPHKYTNVHKIEKKSSKHICEIADKE